jgi:cysteinyl-tRNA synthetase
MHNGHINVDGTKMSKSLGNFILAKDFIKEYDSNSIKLAMFKTHYRLPFNIKEELLSESKQLNEKIYNTLKQANLKIQLNNLEVNYDIKDKKLEDIMNEDFNTPNVITYLIDLVKELNIALRNKGDITELYSKILLICHILGLHYEFKTLSIEDKELYKKWEDAKSEKNFELADMYRKELIDSKIL